MKMKSLVLLAMAIGCGLVAMLGVQQVLSGDKRAPEETGKVLVTVTNIMPGQPLDDANVTFKEWPKNQIPPGAVTTREQFAERSLRVSAVPNEVVMVAKLNDKGVFGASSEIPEGMRIVTVPVNVTKTHSGLILPGDRVDLVVTYNVHSPEHGDVQKAKTILQYIEVFATDNIRQSAVPNGEGKEVSAKNISLLVTPEQVNVVKLAEKKGEISLSLRHRGDDTEVHPPDVDDTMFEGMKISRVQDAKHPAPDKDENAESAESVQQALENETSKTAAAETAPAKPAVTKEEAPPKPTWTLRVYEGDKLREEQVELPEEKNETTKIPDGENRWSQFLKGVFRDK
jgi:pilus assembly protein CpaB